MNPFGDRPVGDNRNPFGDEPVYEELGLPVGTPTREVARTIGPIAGDVLMTALAPQGRGLTMGGKALNLGIRSLMSGAGSFGGSVAGQKIAGQPIDYGEAAKEGVAGLAGEPALTGLGAALKGTMKHVGKPLVDFATGFTPWAKQIEKRMAKSAKASQKALMETETDAAEKFIYDIAPDVVKKQDVPINDIDLQVAAARDETRLIYNKYESALDEYANANNGVIHLDNTTQFLNDLREEVGGDLNRLSKDNALFKEFGFSIAQRDELKPLLRDAEGLSPKSVKYIMATMNKNYKKLPPSKQKMLDKLKESMLDDIGRAVGAKDLKQEADTLFKETKRFLEIKKLFNKGMWTDRSGRNYIQPYSIAKEIYANQKKILDPRFGSPELWPKLKALADHYFEIYPKFQKIEVDDAFDIIKAWQTLSPKSKKVMSGIAGAGKQALKATGKAAVHLGGQEVDFPVQGM